MTKKVNDATLKMKATTTGFTKKQICYLENLSKSTRFSGRRKISRMTVLQALLMACKDIEINVSDVKSEKELFRRVLLAFDRSK